MLKHLSYSIFFLLDRVGLHVLPKHYYTAVPDYAWLNANKSLWTRQAAMIGVEWDLDQQFEWLSSIIQPYYHEVEGLGRWNRIVDRDLGPGYGPIESQVLHCFVRSAAPARIIEIGSGASTACMLEAARMNLSEGRPGARITCVEPYPHRALEAVEEITHIPELCQSVSTDLFLELQAGDLLFIDCSHSVKIGSDVVRICLDIVPRLRPGVYVHFHDINLPYVYPRDALMTYFGWQESAMLLALLTGNERLQVMASLAALHYERPGKLRHILKDYHPQANEEGLPLSGSEGHFPSSIYLRTR